MPDVYILEHAVVTEKKKLGGHWAIAYRYVTCRWAFDSYNKAVEYRDSKPYALLDAPFGNRKVSPYKWNGTRERVYDEFQIFRLEVN